MVNEILTGAGFVEGVTYNETQFKQPPKDSSYAVYLDNWTVRGSDNQNLIIEHAVSLELYEYYKDPESEAKIEAEFNRRGIEFDKQARYWIQEEQLYQVVYDFNYISKGDFK